MDMAAALRRCFSHTKFAFEIQVLWRMCLCLLLPHQLQGVLWRCFRDSLAQVLWAGGGFSSTVSQTIPKDLWDPVQLIQQIPGINMYKALHSLCIQSYHNIVSLLFYMQLSIHEQPNSDSYLLVMKGYLIVVDYEKQTGNFRSIY